MTSCRFGNQGALSGGAANEYHFAQRSASPTSSHSDVSHMPNAMTAGSATIVIVNVDGLSLLLSQAAKKAMTGTRATASYRTSTTPANPIAKDH